MRARIGDPASDSGDCVVAVKQNNCCRSGILFIPLCSLRLDDNGAHGYNSRPDEEKPNIVVIQLESYFDVKEAEFFTTSGVSLKIDDQNGAKIMIGIMMITEDIAAINRPR